MLLLECRNIRKSFRDRLIVEMNELLVYSNDRIGVVGVNGAGKTTLLNILCKRIEPDDGFVRIHSEYSFISQLEQPESKQINREMASKWRVADTWDETMSGGEKTRFKLAQNFENSRMLTFADEPTSCLDLEGIELLESSFADYCGGLVLVSHDRSLLDSLCTNILEIENGKVKAYRGNYSQFSLQKANEREREQSEYLQYSYEKKRLERASRKLREGSKAIRKTPKRMGNSEARLHKMGSQRARVSQDQARKSVDKRIDRLEVKEKPLEQAVIGIGISKTVELHSKVIVEGTKICKRFGDKTVFNDAEFSLFNGAKTSLLGPNGSGKSTLLEMIMQQDQAIRIAPSAKIGYFSQNMDTLKENLTILDNMLSGGIHKEITVRTLLAGLLFKQNDVHKKAGMLSAGERVRACFAKILLQDINLLILDEPTNYLDLVSIEVMEKALCRYDGSLLFATHDRGLISSVADSIMTIESHKIRMFNGTYAEYVAKRRNRGTDSTAAEKRIMVLQHRLAEIISKLSLPSKEDDVRALDSEYYEVLVELKELKAFRRP